MTVFFSIRTQQIDAIQYMVIYCENGSADKNGECWNIDRISVRRNGWKINSPFAGYLTSGARLSQMGPDWLDPQIPNSGELGDKNTCEKSTQFTAANSTCQILRPTRPPQRLRKGANEEFTAGGRTRMSHLTRTKHCNDIVARLILTSPRKGVQQNRKRFWNTPKNNAYRV